MITGKAGVADDKKGTMEDPEVKKIFYDPKV